MSAYILITTLILLSLSGAAYCAPEQSRQAIRQRARSELEDILNTDEFKTQRPQQSWLSRQIDKILSRLSRGSEFLSVFLELLLYLAIIFAVIFISILIATHFRRRASGRRRREVSPDVELNRDPEAARAKAYEYLQRGEHRNAIRYLYLSLLLHLDKSGLIQYDIARTNGEYIRAVEISTSDQAERFTFLTRFFERKWYGMEESTSGDFREYEAAFVEMVGERAG